LFALLKLGTPSTFTEARETEHKQSRQALRILNERCRVKIINIQGAYF
jgi:hypothetical protein